MIWESGVLRLCKVWALVFWVQVEGVGLGVFKDTLNQNLRGLGGLLRVQAMHLKALEDVQSP